MTNTIQGLIHLLKTVTLDSSKWTVHIEADGKDEKGNPTKVVADGKLENIGSYNRTISGTWTQGTAKGTFRLKRVQVSFDLVEGPSSS